MNVAALLSRPWVRRALAALPFLALVLPRLGFVPLWDGAAYGDCLNAATARGFDLWALNCFDHPSMAYMGVLALAWKVSGGATWAMLLANAALGAVAVGAFLALLDRLAPKTAPLERVVVAAALGAVPPLAAGSLNLTVDYGTVVAFVLLLVALAASRPLLALVAGLALTFTKEPGIALAGLATGTWLVAFALRPPGTWADKLRRALQVWPMLLVPVAFGAYLGARVLRHQPLWWSLDADQRSLLDVLTSFQLVDPVFRSYLTVVFVANFMWVPSLVLVAGAVLWAARRLSGQPRGEAAGGGALWLGSLLVLATWLLTRHRTYINVRYFLPLFPLALACAWLVLVDLVRPARVRAGLFAGLLALFVLSAFRTADPLSRAVFGSFAFGRHELLATTSLTGECCARGRDQLAYNLEFTHLHELLDDVLAEVRPTDAAPLVLAKLGRWYTIEAVTGDPPRRALRGPGLGAPPVLIVDELDGRASLPATLTFLDLPYADGASELARLVGRYTVVGRRTFDRGGYTVVATRLQRR